MHELLAYLGGLGFSELYRRGEKREARLPRERSAERSPAPERAPNRVAGGRTAARAAAVTAPPAAVEPARREAEPPAFSLAEAPGPALPAAERARRLELLRLESSRCKECRLCRGRNQVVFGHGHGDADLMFIGEGPGAEEDRQGLPFVGAAGELLTKIIQAIELDRSQVYIANIVKCRPPGNRDPEHDEIDACLPILLEQIELVRPRLIVALGRVAARTLLHSAASLSELRGAFYPVRGAEMRVTYHPAALLYDESLKRPTWDDMKIVRDRLKELRAEGPKP